MAGEIARGYVTVKASGLDKLKAEVKKAVREATKDAARIEFSAATRGMKGQLDVQLKDIRATKRGIINFDGKFDEAAKRQLQLDVDGITGYMKLELRIAAGEKRKIQEEIRKVQVDVSLNITQKSIDALRAKLRTIEPPFKVPVTLDPRITELRARIAAIRGLKVPVKLELENNTLDRATSSLIGLEKQALGAGLSVLTLSRNVTAAGGALTFAGQAAGLTLGAFGQLGTSIVQLSGVAGALPGIFSTLGGVFATVKVGMSGFADALKAGITARTDAANKSIDYSRQLRDAYFSEQSAQLGVTNANTQQLLARHQLTDAILTQKRALEDLDDKLKGSALDESQAALDYHKALKQYALDKQGLGADPDQLAQDSLNVQRAYLQMGTAAKQHARDVVDATKTRAQGVSGNDNVIGATMNVRNSDFGVQQAAQSMTQSMEALKDLISHRTDDIGAFQRALKRLSPNAQDAANKLLELRGAWHQTTTTVQDKLFAGVADQLDGLAKKTLPTVTTGLGGIATAVNGMFTELSQYLQSPKGVAALGKLFGAIHDTVKALQPAVQPFVDALLTLFSGSNSTLPGFATNLVTIATTFDKFIHRVTADGSFSRWVSTGMHAAGQLFGAIKNLGSVLGGLFKAFDTTNGKGLDNANSGLGRLAKTINDPATQKSLRDFKTALEAPFKVLTNNRESTGALKSVGGIIKQFALDAAGGLRQVSDVLFPLIVKYAPQISAALGSLVQIYSGVISHALPGIAKFIPAIREGLGYLAAVAPQVGDKLGKLATTVAPLVAQIGKALAAVLPALLDELNQLATVAVPVLSKVLGLIADHPKTFVALAGAVIALGVAFKGLRGAGAVADDLVKLPKQIGGVLGEIGKVLRVGRFAFTDFIAGFRSAGAAASAFTGRMGTVGGAVARVFRVLTSPIESISNLFRSGGPLARLGSFLGRFVTEGGKAGKTVAGFGRIGEVFGSVGKFLGPVGIAVTVLTAALSDPKGRKALGELFTAVKQQGPKFAQFFDGMGKLFAAFNPIIVKVFTTLTPLLVGVIKIIGELFGFLGTTMGAAAKIIGGVIELFQGHFKKGWEDIKAGALAALKGVGTLLVNVVKDIFHAFVNTFKSLFGIHSPSTVMKELGGFLLDGLVAGLRALWKLTKVVAELGAKLLAELLDPKSGLHAKIAEAVETVKPYIGSAFRFLVKLAVTAISSLGAKLKQQLLDPKSGLRTKLAEVMEDAKSALVDGAHTMMQAMADKIASMGDVIKLALLKALKAAYDFGPANNVLNKALGLVGVTNPDKVIDSMIRGIEADQLKRNAPAAVPAPVVPKAFIPSPSKSPIFDSVVKATSQAPGANIVNQYGGNSVTVNQDIKSTAPRQTATESMRRAHAAGAAGLNAGMR